MTDSYGREISYIRISVTDLCDLRCRYCMPEEGICKKDHKDMLEEDELVDAVKAAASLGIRKVRITGGEPLVKRNIVSICHRVAAIDGIKEVCLTTNGILLRSMAVPLKSAGVKRLNLSLDTLDEMKYRYITRWGNLADVRKGLETALETGFDKVKINTVLIGGFNDDEIGPLSELTLHYPIDVRFIEMMPMCDSGDFEASAYISSQVVLDKLPEAEPIPTDGGVAALYRLPGALGNIGLISPVTAHFCGTCNRIRLTADGRLKPCLHSGAEYSIKGRSPSEMRQIMEQVIWNKPEWHGGLASSRKSRAGRNMNQIGG